MVDILHFFFTHDRNLSETERGAQIIRSIFNQINDNIFLFFKKTRLINSFAVE